jgi:gliding motility-associated-like protein
LLAITLKASAQSNAYWNGFRANISLEGYELQDQIGSNNGKVSVGHGSLSANNGKCLYYAGYNTLNNRKHRPLLYSDLLHRNPSWSSVDYLFRLSQETVGYIHVYDTFAYARNVDRSYKTGVYLSMINSNLDGGLGGVDTSRYNILLKELNKKSSYFSSSIVRRDSNSFLIFSNINDTLWAFQIEDGLAYIKDSMPITYLNFLPLDRSSFDKEFNETSIAVTASGENILLLKKSELEKEVQIGRLIKNYTMHRSSILEKIKFDIKEMRFRGVGDRMLFDSWTLDSSQNQEYNNCEFVYHNSVSENDSFLYLSSRNCTDNFLNNGLIVNGSSLYQINIHRFDLGKSLIYASSNQNRMLIKESPKGQILVFQQLRNEDGIRSNIIHGISNPNDAYPSLDFSPNMYSHELKNGGQFEYLPSHVKDHIRLKYSIEYGCTARVRFSNFSNPYREFDTYTWYFTKEDGSIDTLQSVEPTLEYNKSGNYFYKMYARSNKDNGYGEMWYDTLHIRIPPKPIAAFTAPDTVVCAHTAVVFENQSTTDTIHPTNGEKWVWTFGDGETVSHTERSRSVTHTYTQPGTYTVSLFYSNGFCDSTLVKNQYITVVDAPAPGFTVDNNRGCTPFKLSVTDTVTVNTVKKEYNFYDGQGWQELPLSQTTLHQTYTQPGNYWVTQRLYGYTGCITQQDSVRIYVNAGLTQADTLHMLQGSYTNHPSAEGALVINAEGLETWRSNRQDTKEPITLHWSSHPAAVSYELSRNGTYIATLDSPQVRHTDFVERPHPFTYTITGIDSCGTPSASGRTISPMYLTGRASKDNAMAILEFSPYTEQLTEQQYFIQAEEGGEWQVLAPLGTATRYTDAEFLGRYDPFQATTQRKMTTLEKCYRVANQTGQLSNVLCLPYTPTIFLPTAFTPNEDGLNDVYRPITFGIASYTVRIYNRWGQQVAKFTEKDKGWQATAMPMGAYQAVLSAMDNQGYRHNASTTVTVVR